MCDLAEPLQVNVTALESSALLLLVGELDVATSSLLRSAVKRLDHSIHVVLDLAGLRFVDASGLGEFVRAHNALTQQGGCLRLRNPSTMCRRLLAITDLDHLLEDDDRTCCSGTTRSVTGVQEVPPRLPGDVTRRP